MGHTANSSRRFGWANLLDGFKLFSASQAAQPATAHSSTKLGWANLLDEYDPFPGAKQRSRPRPTRQENWAGPIFLTSSSPPLRARERAATTATTATATGTTTAATKGTTDAIGGCWSIIGGFGSTFVQKCLPPAFGQKQGMEFEPSLGFYHYPVKIII